MEQDLNDCDDKSNCPDLSQFSALKLAYLGDALYDFYVREYVLLHVHGSMDMLNRLKIKLVCAASQSEVIGYLISLGFLTDDEMAVYRRARNHSNASHSKNSSIQDYRRATGFEAVVGFLYLKGDRERLLSVLCQSVRHLLEEK